MACEEEEEEEDGLVFCGPHLDHRQETLPNSFPMVEQSLVPPYEPSASVISLPHAAEASRQVSLQPPAVLSYRPLLRKVPPASPHPIRIMHARRRAVRRRVYGSSLEKEFGLD
eukprot:764884-Hanusia_phi.AAC.8